MKDLKRENRQGERTRTAPQHRPNSFLYLHHQHAAYSRPPLVIGPPSHLTSNNLPRGRPVPTWLSPTRLPNLYRDSGLHGAQQPERTQPAPVLYRKTRGGKTRAMSMNLDLELGRSENSIRGRRGERMEVIRVVDGAQSQRGRVGVPQGFILNPASIQQRDPFPHFVQNVPHLPPTPSGWTDQSTIGSSTVVLRRSAVNPRDRTRAWRRHTVVV